MAKHKVYKTYPARKYILLSLLLFLFIGIGYSLLSTNLNIFGNINVEKYNSLYNVLRVAAEEGTYAEKYTGAHQDSFTGGGKDIYYWTSHEIIERDQEISFQNNVVFANTCWKMIRTTDTGGVKLLYNGVYDGDCNGNNGHPIFNYDYRTECTGSGCEYLQNIPTSAKRFEWDGSTFRLVDPVIEQNLGQRFICLNGSDDNCNRVGYFISYSNVGEPIRDFYSIVPLDIAPEPIIGRAPFNNSDYVNNFLIGVNYRYTRPDYSGITGYHEYDPVHISKTSQRYYSDSYEYNNTDGYSLINPTTTYSIDKHYTCSSWAPSECGELLYIFGEDENTFLAMKLYNGESLNDVIEKLTSNDESLALYDSIAALVIDGWYNNYIDPKSEYLEDTIFCDDRSVSVYGSFDPSSTVYKGLRFTSVASETKDLSCHRNNDKLSINNPDARLDKPVGLLTKPEVELYSSKNNYMYAIGEEWWLMTPHGYNVQYGVSVMRTVSDEGFYNLDSNVNTNSVIESLALRPVISLKPGVVYSSGDGSVDNPYIIDTD